MNATRKQLELAAKALGGVDRQLPPVGQEHIKEAFYWTPATSQADSDNMACDLKIDVAHDDYFVTARNGRIDSVCAHDNTIEGRRAAKRWAVFLVAVEIGRGMK